MELLILRQKAIFLPLQQQILLMFRCINILDPHQKIIFDPNQLSVVTLANLPIQIALQEISHWF
jgi:hypothetical protein